MSLALHPFRFDDSIKVWWQVKVTRILIMHVFLFILLSLSLFLLRYNVPKHIVLTHSLCASLNVKDQVSY